MYGSLLHLLSSRLHPELFAPVLPTLVGPGRHRRRRVTTFHITNGKRECARRLRQIAAGSLRVENGLVR